MNKINRKKEHQKNYELEKVFHKLEILLKGVGENQEFDNNYPLIFIMGCARSGSTLLLQYLASHDQFSYPTNLLSRFYYAPYIGALIQRMLYDLDDRHELLRYFEHQDIFESKLGKTKGILSPHEFWYYWRRYFKFHEFQKLSEKEVEKVNWKGFVNGLYSICNVFNKPLVLKGMMLNWNIEALSEKIPNAFFIHIKRDIAYNAQSLLLARKNFYGSYESWYSFKPPEYSEIIKKPFWEQVVDQVYFTNSAIEKSLASIRQEKYISIQYEDLCNNPPKTLNKLIQSLEFDLVLDNRTFIGNKNINIEREIWNELTTYARQYK